ncbi:MAG: hypothetical protein H6656_13765 [Ardenticatenaceae bacterium]|nr:hypothetical protein [Ardenticatenaceae bacterium]
MTTFTTISLLALAVAFNVQSEGTTNQEKSAFIGVHPRPIWKRREEWWLTAVSGAAAGCAILPNLRR